MSCLLRIASLSPNLSNGQVMNRVAANTARYKENQIEFVALQISHLSPDHFSYCFPKQNQGFPFHPGLTS